MGKKAILLSFRTNKMSMSKGPYTTWYDKVPGKSVEWGEEDWKKAGYRHVPNGVVRKGSFIAKNVVLMPCFVNLGAYVDEGTMIDTWASVGSCAQIGKLPRFWWCRYRRSSRTTSSRTSYN